MSTLVIVIAAILLFVACGTILMAFLLPGKTGPPGATGSSGPPGTNSAGLFPAFPIVVSGGPVISSINTLYYYGSTYTAKTVAVTPINLTGVLVVANATGGALAVTLSDGRSFSLKNKTCLYVSVYPGGINVQTYTFST